MDPEAFLEMANQVTKLKMYPYFDIAHCIICCLYVREDLGTGSHVFSRKHPLSNWISSMVTIFAGGFLSNWLLGEPILGAIKNNQQGSHVFSRKHPLSNWISSMVTIFAGGFLSNWLLGEPILGAIKNNQQLIVATLVWYAIFYSPFDVGYKVTKFLPLKVLAAAMKEVYRVKKINDGVVHAAKVFPNGYLIMLIIGTIKGNGSGFLKVLERLFRGVWTPNAVEILQPSFATKASIAAAFVFVLDKKTDFISAPHALVYFGICIFFVYFKLSSILLGIHDPFIPFENLFCGIFMGGIWDSLSRTLGGSKAAAAEKSGETAKNA